MAAHIRLFIGIALATLMVIFTIQNVEATAVHFLFWKIELSRSLLIFGVFVVGVTSGWIGSSWLHFIRKRQRVQEAKAS